MNEKETQTNESRRDFIKKTAYAAPVVMTMAVVPTVHAVGSVNGGSIPGLPDDNGPS